MAPTLIRCPTCGRMHEWSTTNKWRPFCSERCKLIDLGAWIQERHAIPGEPAVDLPADEDVDGPGQRH